MEGEESGTLPEELVEMIIARMPYPSIFKARLLSKSWYDRFEPISRLEDEKGKCRAKSFHRVVADRCHYWDTFCPIYTNQEDPVVYNQTAREWQKLPSLEWLHRSFPPEAFSLPDDLHGDFSILESVNASVCVHLIGAFLYGTWYAEGDKVLPQLFVANILTKEWKQLPRRPAEAWTDILCMQLDIDPSSEAYKLIIVCQENAYFEHHSPDFEQHALQIYDSKLESWSDYVFVSDVVSEDEMFCYAFLKGVFYMVARNKWHRLLAFNVLERNFEELRLSFINDEAQISVFKLLVCDGNLVIILCKSMVTTALKIDLVSLELLEVARCPARSGLDTIGPRDNGANCYFFETTHWPCHLLGYNKLKDEWKFFSAEFSGPIYGFHWSESSFQPGLNPFMAA